MSRKKKNPYDKLELLASIDTVSIKTTDDFIIPAQTQDGRPFKGAKLVGRDNRSETPIIKLNVNTYAERELYNLDEYMNNLQLILEDMHIQNYWYSRVDIRFDSFIYSWDDLAKLNRLVIHCNYGHHNERIAASRKGRKMTAEQRARMSELHRGRGIKAVVQMDRNGNPIAEYESIKAAAEALNIDPGNISSACRGYRPSAGGFLFAYKVS